MGLIDKLFVEFQPETFSYDDPIAGPVPIDANNAGLNAVPDSQVGPVTFMNLFGANIALVFVHGEQARALEQEGEGAQLAFAVDAVAALLGSDVRGGVTGRSLWSRGAYSYAVPGGASARAVLGTPVQNRLFFAGEHVSVASHNTIYGAYDTGIKAAQAAAAAVRA
jgi:monoamine oxidase